MLQPRSGEDFLVLVLSDGTADKAWGAYVAVARIYTPNTSIDGVSDACQIR
jgi:hypothetical protein